MVELNRICFAYPGQRQLLNEVSIRFPEGKVTTIIGPNGSGKSTLLKVSSRILKPDSGTVLMNGHDIAHMKPKELAKAMALLRQSNHPLEIPVKDLVAYGRYPYQQYGRGLTAKDQAVIERAMKSAQIENEQDHIVSHLSGGQQQRAYIAMALAQDTKLVFLDEPTTCLDVHVSFEVMELVRRLNKEGRTVIMVLHDLSLALEYSDYIVLMDRGRVAAKGTPEEIIASGKMDEVFHIRTCVLHQHDRQYYHFEKKQSVCSM